MSGRVANNKTALITGASSGIGKTFAQALAAKGANVILVACSGNKCIRIFTDWFTEKTQKAILRLECRPLAR